MKFRRMLRNRLFRMKEILRVIDFIPESRSGANDRLTSLEYLPPSWSGSNALQFRNRTYRILYRRLVGNPIYRLFHILHGHRCFICGSFHSTFSCFDLLATEVRFARTGDYMGLTNPELFLERLEGLKARRWSLVLWLLRSFVRRLMDPVVRPLATANTVFNVANDVSYISSGRDLSHVLPSVSLTVASTPTTTDAVVNVRTPFGFRVFFGLRFHFRPAPPSLSARTNIRWDPELGRFVDL